MWVRFIFVQKKIIFSKNHDPGFCPFKHIKQFQKSKNTGFGKLVYGEQKVNLKIVHFSVVLVAKVSQKSTFVFLLIIGIWAQYAQRNKLLNFRILVQTHFIAETMKY